MAKGAEAEKGPMTSMDAPGDMELLGGIAQAAAQHTPGLKPGAVENSLASVLDLAETHNPNLAMALRGVLGAVVDYHEAAMPAEFPERPQPVPPTQLQYQPDLITGGM